MSSSGWVNKDRGHRLLSFLSEMHLERISDLYSLGDKEPRRFLNFLLTRGNRHEIEIQSYADRR